MTPPPPDAAPPTPGEQLQHFTVHHDGVTIPVTRGGGRGRTLVLCPGLCSTQADLHELITLLRHDHDVVTFDHRGHGLTSAGGGYTFDAFLGDFTAVMAAVMTVPEHPRPAEPPVLVGYSLGADLAVHHTAASPGSVAGLVIVDGANPVPGPFVTEADLADFRAMADATRREAERFRGTPRRVLLTTEDILELQRETDRVRAVLLDRYREIEHPVSLIMSTTLAGDRAEGRAPHYNHLWRTGVARLVRERPGTSVNWFDADHRLVFTHARQIAQTVRASLTRMSA
ncbi:alpha/beta fold hydrolase [Streptomyces sp. NPDC088789]|uniref:alpha/beta fold hydrolase n=1 Tax=Streptomyces sp. NPDC088789 TaxID=3365899 RepID=UPI00381498AB